MSLPDSNRNEPSKMKKLLNGGSSGEEDAKESPLARLQRSVGTGTAPKKVESVKKQETPKLEAQKPSPETSVPKSKPKKEVKLKSGEYKFLPAFWTIASVMSFAVNIVLLIVLLVVLQNFNMIGVAVNDLSSYLLGGLYNNFVRMDQAHIKTTIPVSKEIPVQFSLNVSGPTNVTLSEDVPIPGALVTVNTGGLNINNARANIVLPQGTVLPIFIENLVVPVDQKVLAELNVEVDIPLKDTELHEPFIGLRKVVEPFYCLLEPFAELDGIKVCP